MSSEPSQRGSAASQYRLIRATRRGQLLVRSARPDVIELQIRWAADIHSDTGRYWLRGPVRACRHVLDALHDALVNLGSEATPKTVMQLARRIDRRLHDRLVHYALLRAGRYDSLESHVQLVGEDDAAQRGSLPPNGWFAAELGTGASPASDSAGAFGRPGRAAGRELLMLTRCHGVWELWARADSPYVPRPVRRKLCSTSILPDEPHLVAELLVYFALRDTGLVSRLTVSDNGIIPAERLTVLRDASGDAAQRAGNGERPLRRANGRAGTRRASLLPRDGTDTPQFLRADEAGSAAPWAPAAPARACGRGED